MKIGMVCYPTYGGSGVVATELGRELAHRGHEIHFISYQPPVRFQGVLDRLSYHEVEIASYPVFKHPPYLLAVASKMAEVAEAEALDLFHVHYAIPHTISGCLAREILQRKDLPVITTLHGTDITIVGRDPAYFRVVQFALRDSDGITAVSRSLAEETRSTFGYEGPMEVIYNFIDPERFHPGVDQDLRRCYADPDEKILVHVSNFRPVKNTPDVVRIFAEVLKHIPARLLLVGDGPERITCRQVAESLGVSDRTRFLGETPEVERLLACADLFLLPSSKESFGLAALEAMACGAPVVASRAGGLPEVVTDGETGRLFDPGDVEGMAGGVLEILSDDARRDAMGEAARNQAVARFSPPIIIPLYEAFYEKVRRGMD
ncbi:MAG: N-acetyl-alpha-D-glucosaminyl L-malate synthase BshA [Planctomycetota bacterium]|jgi:N-acetyl-alpha-D-glucosaminyl L-malate synthase BshA